MDKYDIFVYNGVNASIDAKHSSQGWDWITLGKEDVTGGKYPYNAFTYNGQSYVYYYDSDYLKYATWNGSAWTTGSTGVLQYYSDYVSAYGADVKYYNGEWCLVAGHTPTDSSKLRFYTSNTPLGSFTYHNDIDDAGHSLFLFTPSLNILNGKLVLTHIDSGEDLHWWVYGKRPSK